ncbi:hypothetical protein ACRRTK_001461 [Alexandromys fortis]
MAKAAATLCVLLSCLWPTVQADAHILSCSFTVKTRSIHTESIPQCSVDEVLLHCDKDNTRKEGNAPKECADLFPKLKDIEEELRSQLDTMEREGDLNGGDHSLLVIVVSLYKEGQPIYGYWNFTLDVHHSFGFNRFDSKNKKWAVTHNKTPGIDKWQKNTELAQHLDTFIRGDSRRCFLEILPQSKKIAGPTSRPPDIGIVTSPSQLPSTMNTTQLPSAKQPPSKGGSGVTAALISIPIFIIIVLPVIIYIYMCVNRNSSQGDRNLQQLINCPYNCHKPEEREAHGVKWRVPQPSHQHVVQRG